tara:strand:- start:1483 stop:1857 length:375 start_codon:yes stop_codon:yes gene_type:complete
MDLKEIEKYSSSNIFQQKQKIFENLNLSIEIVKKYHNSLKYYILIDNISEINDGIYIRWINEKNVLVNGAFVCDIEIFDYDIIINCKTITNRFISISYNNNYVFKKITDDDLILISLMNNLNKN